MPDLLTHLVDAPLANIFILAGLAFLAVAIIGKVAGKIEPNTTGRVMSGVLGAVLLIYGIHSHAAADAVRDQAPPEPVKPISGADAADEHHKQRAEKTPAPGSTPQKSATPVSDSRLSGAWKNDNPQTHGITRLEVEQGGDQVNVHAWGACGGGECDWGTAKGTVNGGSANILWDQGAERRSMTLFVDGARLRMVLDTTFTSNGGTQHGVEYFVRQP